MDRNSDVIHHKNDNYDTNNFPAELEFLHDIINTDPALDLLALWHESRDYETPDTQLFDQMLRAPLPKASADDLGRRRPEEEFTNDIEQKQQMEESYLASSYITKNGHITTDIHRDENYKIQNEKTAPVSGEYTKMSDQNESFFGARNAYIHRNENSTKLFNFEDLIQKDDLIIVQPPINTNEQQSKIQTALDCFLEKDCYRKASDEERKNAARILHEHGQVKRVNKRSNSGFDQQRRFHCDLCLAGMIRTFTNMEALRRHFCQHLDHYPYKCPFPTCEMGFYRTDKRAEHIKDRNDLSFSLLIGLNFVTDKIP
ncbi:unnamed protein product [Oikopleura dioica]|uniref:C2H2-type domain-containing protein n=1 Tax=Oikopleura dioica TaxID=34765 RepID=E4X461_OIKDI|nr:unnamed protein product [Oikopleura dioica]